MLIVNDRIAIPDSEFEIDYARSGGPGGQNVNKVASKAIVRWKPAESPSLPPSVKDRLLKKIGSRLTTEGELIVTSQLTRDQGRNRDDCLEKLRRLVLAAVEPPKVRRPTRPTRASQQKRLESKDKRSETKRLRKKPTTD